MLSLAELRLWSLSCAGCLSVLHILAVHLVKHMHYLENALQLVGEAVSLYWQGDLLVAVARKTVGVAKLSSC